MWNEDVVSEQVVIKFKLPQHWMNNSEPEFLNQSPWLKQRSVSVKSLHNASLGASRHPNPFSECSLNCFRGYVWKQLHWETVVACYFLICAHLSPLRQEGEHQRNHGAHRGGRGKRLVHSSNCCTDCIPDQHRLLLKRPRQKEENQKLVPMMIQQRVTTLNKVC